MKDKQIVYKHAVLPYLLILPELAIILLFFFWPALQAFYQSVLIEDPFGLRSTFVWFRNYAAVFADEFYLASLKTTAVLSFWVTCLAMLSGLGLAWMVFQLRRRRLYQTLIIWPYALAPAVAGVIWYFIFNPTLGVLPYFLAKLGFDWDPLLRGGQSLLMVTIALSWKQIAYNFLFFLAGLEGIPKSLTEAAIVYGATGRQTFFKVTFPLLSPTTFFLFTMNMLYSLFDSFGTIHSLTGGGPNHATETMVYKVYVDGFIGLNLGGSSAQSVVIMIMAIALTLLQFRVSGKRVVY